MNRTDIHFHLLPGVDDGPATVEEAIALAREAVRDGTGTIVTTPHVRSDFVTDVWGLRDRVRELKATLAGEGIRTSILLGAELGHDMVGRLRQDELAAIAQGPPHRRWLLVEAPFGGLTPGFNLATDELRDRGFGVVLAHPERSAGLLEANRCGLEHELAAGSALQVNGLSLAGRHGDETVRVALQLAHLGLITAIASDAHGRARPPALTTGLKALFVGGVAPGAARALVDAGPRRLMAQGVEVVPVTGLRKR